MVGVGVLEGSAPRGTAGGGVGFEWCRCKYLFCLKDWNLVWIRLGVLKREDQIVVLNVCAFRSNGGTHLNLSYWWVYRKLHASV